MMGAPQLCSFCTAAMKQGRLNFTKLGFNFSEMVFKPCLGDENLMGITPGSDFNTIGT
jgi:hypothetical protein